MDLVLIVARTFGRTVLDVLPVLSFLVAFQLLVIRRPLPDWQKILSGTIFVIVGLSLFLLGLEQALFPVGRLMARQLSDPSLVGMATTADGSVLWHQFMWLYAFAFLIGFSTTIAEPSLLAVAIKANEVSGGSVHVWGLRVTVAVAVGLALVIGVLRILTGWSLPLIIIGGYVTVIAMTGLAPPEIIGIAYDSGGVTTSTVTVPLVAALGIGLASSVAERNPMTDGFGLIALASLTPIIFVLGYGMLVQWTLS